MVETPSRYRLREDVRRALAAHGLMPKKTTSPERLREFVNDLYRYELRRLRVRLRRKEFPQREYFDRVVAVHRRYPLMSLPVRFWTGDATHK